MNPILKILFILSKKTFRAFRVLRGEKEVEVIDKPAAWGAGINEEGTWKGIMEWWNLGIVEEGAFGRDERLLVQGTQTRLRLGYGEAGACPSQSRYSPSFQHSRIPIFH